MKIEQYISNQALERQNILAVFHQTIIENDKSVKAEVELMMGKEMIVYIQKGLMKYALSSVKKYMSFHVLPIYGSETLHKKYKTLLHKANFQKGCINFNNEDELPLNIFRELIIDCSTIDLVKIREDYLKSRNDKTKIQPIR